VNSAEAKSLQEQIVGLLQAQAPSGFKCIFLNCEMHETPGGMTTSEDVFAVTKPLLGKPRRNQLLLDAPSLKSLNQLGRLLLKDMRRDHVIVDLLIRSDGSHQVFVDPGSMRRLGSDGDDFFKTKHKAYTQIEPWLAQVE
jgi:hypothetical protein